MACFRAAGDSPAATIGANHSVTHRGYFRSEGWAFTEYDMLPRAAREMCLVQQAQVLTWEERVADREAILRVLSVGVRGQGDLHQKKNNMSFKHATW